MKLLKQPENLISIIHLKTIFEFLWDRVVLYIESKWASLLIHFQFWQDHYLFVSQFIKINHLYNNIRTILIKKTDLYMVMNCRSPPPAGGSSGGSRRLRSWAHRPSLLRRLPWTPDNRPPRILRYWLHGSSGIHHTVQLDCLNFYYLFLSWSPLAFSSFFPIMLNINNPNFIPTKKLLYICIKI